MGKDKIRVGITQGDINGIGYEVILKTFSTPEMLDLCTPVIYGSAKVAAYHRKALGLPSVPYQTITSAGDAEDDKINLVICTDDEVKVELSHPTPESGKAARDSLLKATEEWQNGLIDVIVTAPIDKHNVQGDGFNYTGHTEYLEDRLGEGRKSLMILAKDGLRVAIATNHLPILQVSGAITRETLKQKLTIFNASLRGDFGISKPRIAVLALNPHAGDNGLIGTEEAGTIIPVIEEMRQNKVLCFGPFPADGFFGSGNYKHFDGVMAMYHDQGLAPFKILSDGAGVNFTAGLPVIRTSPAHGTAFDIAGKGTASEESFREAVYMAMDIFRYRMSEKELHANPLRKQYHEKKDDSDKLNLQAASMKEDE